MKKKYSEFVKLQDFETDSFAWFWKSNWERNKITRFWKFVCFVCVLFLLGGSTIYWMNDFDFVPSKFGFVLLIVIIGLLSYLFVSGKTIWLLCLISYPLRKKRVRELLVQKRCVSRESAGKILGCYMLIEDFHYWESCKCECGKLTRDEGHDWKGCSCIICWKESPEGQHDWNGCRCNICWKIRSEGHFWDGNKCSICGEERSINDMGTAGLSC